jgi:zinc protease
MLASADERAEVSNARGRRMVPHAARTSGRSFLQVMSIAMLMLPRTIRPLPLLATLVLALVLMLHIPASTFAAAQRKVSSFTLANGLEVVVIPDRRAPVVTHMVWYRVGAADEPRGVSGIAHFLEHLMFKGTDKIAPGLFSKQIARNGGQDNAFTTQDKTAYFQRVAKDRLPLVMEMEADRMANLRLEEKDVLTERDVILEERRSRVDNNPTSIMNEMMLAQLYLAHPYRIPVIGWEHEIRKLSRADALAFYKQYYAPNNAILIVAGDVEPDEVKSLAEKHYGPHKPNPALARKRERPMEPEHVTPRRLEYHDARAGKPMFERMYLAPSYASAKPGEAEALDLLMKIVGAGATSRIYKKLVVEEKVASNAGGHYAGAGLDYGRITLYAVAAEGKPLSVSEGLIDQAIADVRQNGVTEEELARAKKVYIAEHIQESDSQSQLARRYGWALTTGQTIKDIEEWPERIAKVTAADIKRAAETHLELRRSVSGQLLPQAPAGKSVATPPKPDRS